MIVLTSTKEKNDSLIKKNPDLALFSFPCIQYAPPSDNYQALDQALKKNHEFEWVFFLSKKAAEVFFERLLSIGGNFFNLSNHLKFAVIGSKTKSFFENELNLPVDFMPAKASSVDFANEFTKQFAFDFHCKFKVLLARSELASDNFKELIESTNNYELVEVPAYNTVEVFEHIDLPCKIDYILFTSPSCVVNFHKKTKAMDLQNIKILSIGAKTSQKINELYPHCDIQVTTEASLEAMLELISN